MEDDAATVGAGCLRAFLYGLIGFAWFFAAHQAVWWYARACHTNPMPGDVIFLVPARVLDWVAMALMVCGVDRLRRRLWPTGPRPSTAENRRCVIA